MTMLTTLNKGDATYKDITYNCLLTLMTWLITVYK